MTPLLITALAVSTICQVLYIRSNRKLRDEIAEAKDALEYMEVQLQKMVEKNFRNTKKPVTPNGKA